MNERRRPSPALPGPGTRYDVLGVGVSAVDLDQAIAELGRWVRDGERHYVCVTSVHGVVEAQGDPELLRIHNASGLTVADGTPIAWAGRVAGVRGMGRVRGSDLLPAVCRLAADGGLRCYFYGGAPGTADTLVSTLQARFSALQVVGTYSPPFRPLTPAEADEVVAMINAARPDFVFVGLSTPKQERWMAANRERLDAAALLGVGGAFDIVAGLVAEAPRWMHPLGIEWMWRLAHEPRRLAGRYFRCNPVFVAGVLRRPPRLRSTSG